MPLERKQNIGNTLIAVLDISSFAHIFSGGCSMDVQRKSDRRTALHLAAQGGHLSSCQVLVEQGGVHINHRDGTVEG